ncbi:spermidine synthase [Neodiprion virginianus]|uniref:spermidine synthase n=1 Tax=Neodiprion virginianus TaxID=2961670 RepID=UPI001EE69F98|nr:spermidine synthase [Neodiprion virginianus]XP_046618136.1 spermidine synthase [Neodiprion virginianus]
MDIQKKGWFSEVHDLWPGITLSLEINNVLYKRRSKYQDILVVETKAHGKMLVLDGVIQCTERDEFSYQEGIAFLPLCSHPNPENVLIIGGGDGGVAREVAKHPGVKRITQVEIDEYVLEAARLHLPFMSIGLSDPKVDLQVGDGFQYMKNHTNEFDVIITDSCDPVGPATCLFEESYFRLMRTALKPGGIICSQSGTAWANLDHVSQTLSNCRSMFPVASYCIVSVPTYPTGQIGFVLGSLNTSTDFKEPVQKFSEKELDDMKIRYYSANVHRAAFVLPRFVAKELLIDNKILS